MLTGGLVPLGSQNKVSTSPRESMDDDEFDAMLGDMLDSPTPSSKNSSKGKKKSPSGKSSKKGSSKSKSSKGDMDLSMSNDMSSSTSSFPSPKKGGRGNSNKLLSVNDDDRLSPANSPLNARGNRGSPTNFDNRDQWDESSARSLGDKGNKFGFSTDAPHDDGLDDSILGNLLPSGAGGGSKRLTALTKPAVSNKVLQPLDNSFASSNSSLNNSMDNTGHQGKDMKMHPSPPVKQASTSYNKANTTDTTAAPAQGGNRALSIFQSYSQNKNNYDSDSPPGSPPAVARPSIDEANSVPAAAPVAATDPEDDVDMGFIPTSMSTGAAGGGRPSRRQLTGGSSIFRRPVVDPASSLDELDRALGFDAGAATSAAPKPRDPFASSGSSSANLGGNIPPLPHTPSGAHAAAAGSAKGDSAAAKFPSPQRHIVRNDPGKGGPQRRDGGATSSSGSDDDMAAPVRVGAGTILGGAASSTSNPAAGTGKGIAVEDFSSPSDATSSNNAPLGKSNSSLPSIASSSAAAGPGASSQPTAADDSDNYDDDFHAPVPVVVTAAPPAPVEPVVAPVPAPVASAALKKAKPVQNITASFEFEEPMDSPPAKTSSPVSRAAVSTRAERKRSNVAADDLGASTGSGIVLSTATVGGGSGSYHPAWLPASSPGAVTPGGGAPSEHPKYSEPAVAATPAPAASDVHSHTLVRQLQQKLEASQLQYEAVERQLRAEVELWKQKLVSTATSHAQHPSGLASEAVNQQLAQQKRMIAQLEAENARLKDDAIIQSLRHNEEAKYMAEKQRQLAEEAEHAKQVEVQEIQARHDQSVAALKRIHSDELASLKDRAKESDVLTAISCQMKNTSGSLKLMEEQLHLKYKSLEAAREGQMEARERLLSEMEQKARERADAAEAEGFRLKGLLQHMEHMVENLRSQSGEEKERLRMEHSRLQTIQSSLEAERGALHARAQEESASIKQKLLDLEAATRTVGEQKQAAAQEIAEARRKLEADKADFASFARNSTKSAELGFARLKDEEARLLKVREDVSAERNLLEQRKVAAMHDIEAAKSVQQAVQAQYDEIRSEKEQLSQLASELQVASEQVAQRDAQLNDLAATLEEREAIVQNGVREMNESARNLSRKEAEVSAYAQNLEHQQGILEDIDTELLNKKVALAASLRQQDAQRASRTMTSLYSQLRERDSGRGGGFGVDTAARTVPWGAGSGSFGASTEGKKASPVSVAGRPQSPAQPTSRQGANPFSFSARPSQEQQQAGGNNSAAMIKDEIEKSRRVLEASKLKHLKSAHDSSSSTQLFMQNENEFLSTIRNVSSQKRSFNTTNSSSGHLDSTNIYGSYLD